jgi:hypothetical protein
MKVLVDGKPVKCLNDIKVVWEIYNEPDDQEDLIVTLTPEGMVMDKYDKTVDEIVDSYSATSSEMAQSMEG